MVRDRKDTSRWCLYAWIFWHPVARAAPLTPQAGLMHLRPGGPLYPASQPQTDRIAEEVRKVNDIFTQWCGIAFRLCETILLDTSKVIRPTPQGPRRLSDHLSDDGALVLRPGQPRFGEILDEIMTNGQPMAFIEKMRKKCVARLAQTIAHEIGHALGEAAHSTQPNN